MNKAVLKELYKHYTRLSSDKDCYTWKLYVPDTNKPQRKLITDLYHYAIKMLTSITNQYNLVKLGVHKEEHDFLENFLNADIIRQSNSLSNFAWETKNKDSKKKKESK